MLTESEREWLENRKPGDWCVTHDCSAMFEGECISVTCYMDISWLYRDAAEFESRVAAKLAKAFKEYVKRRNCVDFEVGARCPGWEVCAADYKKRLPCDFAIMKGVQLEVEEEMNAEV